MSSKEDILNLINKQFSGQISKEEEAVLKEWYDSSAANRREYKDYYALLRYLRVSNNKKKFEPYVTSAYQQFLQRTEIRLARKTRNIIPYSWMRYAAIFIMAFGLGLLSYYGLQNQSGTPSFSQTIEIPFGSKSKVTLPDGTSVWLNSGSRLSYSEGFGKTDRSITLDGEGYFDVTKNKSLPFEVISGEVKIKVLGTKFNFKSYGEDENARVTLVEGSLNVADVKNEKNGVLLIPNQQAIINKKSDKLMVKDVDAKTYAMWTEPKLEVIDVVQNSTTGKTMASIRVPNVILRNTLFFDEEPLSQIVRDLERAFNVKIEVEDKSLLSERFYGDFRNEETISQILEIMANNNHLRYSISDDQIVIAKK